MAGCKETYHGLEAGDDPAKALSVSCVHRVAGTHAAGVTVASTTLGRYLEASLRPIIREHVVSENEGDPGPRVLFVIRQTDAACLLIQRVGPPPELVKGGLVSAEEDISQIEKR